MASDQAQLCPGGSLSPWVLYSPTIFFFLDLTLLFQKYLCNHHIWNATFVLFLLTNEKDKIQHMGLSKMFSFFFLPPPTTFPLFFLLTSFLLYIRILKYYLIHCLSVWDIQFILNSQLFQVFNILNLLKYCLFLKCSIKEKKSNFVHTFCI